MLSSVRIHLLADLKSAYSDVLLVAKPKTNDVEHSLSEEQEEGRWKKFQRLKLLRVRAGRR